MIGSSWKAVLGALGCAALAFGLSLPAGAQEQTKPLAQQQAPGQVTDAEIASFAKAARKVKQINDEALPQIQAAETPEKAQQLREKAESDMLAAVRNEGLTVDDYNRIYTMAQADPDLRARVIEHMQRTPQ